ncbi:MAG: cytochrome c [Devosia sp.]|nr:cytochrome c [Devosia sp.]
MMPIKTTALALAAALSLGAAATALADAPLTADQAVAARQAAMKADGRALKGSEAFTGDKAISALQMVHDNFAKLPALFTKDSITGKSVALPIIWQEFDKFQAIFQKGADAATDGIAAVKAGDMGKYQADIKTIASTCNECHDTYRAKRNG